MGTNYYLYKKKACPTCGHLDENAKLHIGKSSAGWVFALHVYKGTSTLPCDLEEWIPLFFDKQNSIYDEYGKQIDPQEMVQRIAGRDVGLQRAPEQQTWGPGTWDYHAGDFS